MDVDMDMAMDMDGHGMDMRHGNTGHGTWSRTILITHSRKYAAAMQL